MSLIPGCSVLATNAAFALNASCCCKSSQHVVFSVKSTYFTKSNFNRTAFQQRSSWRKSTTQSMKSHRNTQKENGTSTSSSTPSMKAAHEDFRQRKIGIAPKISAITMTCIFGYSIYTRKWREDHLVELPLVDTNHFYFEEKVTTNNNSNHQNSKKNKLKRNLHILSSIIERNGLMGKKHTVKEELDHIRSWHQNHGYKGGVVLRELHIPLFDPQSDNDDDQESIMQPDEMKQRECYYLYYEIKPNGETLHQIFCRGTTISDDVYTCLQSRLVYDEELGIHVHSGFKDHANRLIQDALPLLGPPFTLRSTVEVSGHSLGGAVAFLVAMKLKKMGYNVSKVTAVAGARFCDPQDVSKANELLPKDALRIEDDLDGVPFLPPWASGVGDKLWLVNDCKNNFLIGTFQSSLEESSLYEPKYVSREDLVNHKQKQQQKLSWVDDFWTNVRIPEILTVINNTHRIRSHQEKIHKLIENKKSDGQYP